MKNKQKGIVTTGFTPSNNELRLKIVKECGLSTYGVYIQILSHRNTSTNECFPKNDIIAEECSCSVANVKKHINKLYDYGYLVISSGYTGKASNYYFPLEIDLNTNKSIYADAELERISNIKRRTKDNIVEEVPAQDTTKLTDEKKFTPVGKYVDELDDMFIDDKEDNITEIPVKDNITKINIDLTVSDVDYMNDFYINMHTYFDVNDKTIKTNKTLINKVNELVGLLEKELNNNSINVPAGKIIDNILDEKQNKWKFYLDKKNPKDDVGICNLIIGCMKNAIKDEINQRKNNKTDDYPPADDSFVDYMNEIEEKKSKVNLSNENYKGDELFDYKPKNKIISINKDKEYIENGVTYAVDKNGFSYVVDELHF